MRWVVLSGPHRRQGARHSVPDQLNAKLIQVAYVSEDLKRSAAWFERHLGAKGFDFYEPVILNDVVVDGEVAEEWAIEIAGTHLGDVALEIIHPLSGAVEMYRDVLVPGAAATFHHVGLRVDDWDEAEAARESFGREWTTRGYTPGVCDFGYVDLRPVVGHYVEFMRLEPEALVTLEELKRKYAAQG
jgi:catechol 2,3-dioxygenase-like lactoylglutathione lyase family enzyme